MRAAVTALALVLATGPSLARQFKAAEEPEGVLQGTTLVCDTTANAMKILQVLANDQERTRRFTALYNTNHCDMYPAGTQYRIVEYRDSTPCIRTANYPKCVWATIPPENLPPMPRPPSVSQASPSR